MTVIFNKKTFLLLCISLFLYFTPQISHASDDSQVAQIPLEDFFKKSKFAGVQLSPNGKYISALVPIQDRMNIAIIDLDTRKARNITSVKDKDISGYLWANDDRLLFFMDNDGDESLSIFAVNRDGSKPRVLSQMKFSSGKIRYTMLLSDLEDEPNFVLVVNNERRAANPDVYKMNIMNGKKKLFQRNPGDVSNWILDWDDNIIGSNVSPQENGGFRTLDKKTGKWDKHFDNEFDDPRFVLVGITGDSNKAYISSSVAPDGSARDKAAIYEYDLTTKKIGKLVFEHPNVDIQGVSMRKKTRDIAAVAAMYGKPEITYLDPEIKSMMSLINEALPETINSITSMNDEETIAIVAASSDIQPVEYYLYDVESKTLEPIAISRPWINPQQMAPMQAITITATDGTLLPGYLTVPKGSDGKNLPTIVNPHGGPWARDGWGYNPEVQFLANRGYAVLQVNFRGSTGFGREHLLKGRKQWGQAMQQDITDALNWAIDQGITDKDRVCIYGASYGGYATMAGLAFTPELYKCGINYVGVTDLNIFDDTMPDAWENSRPFMNEMVGKDPEFLKQWSPTNHADKITAPVLMAYGKRDPRVDIKHAYAMADALKANEIPHSLIIKNKEGHGFRKQENVLEWYGEVESFLDKHLLQNNQSL